jgi:hypothetical protein
MIAMITSPRRGAAVAHNPPPRCIVGAIAAPIGDRRRRISWAQQSRAVFKPVRWWKATAAPYIVVRIVGGMATLLFVCYNLYEITSTGVICDDNVHAD